MTEEEKRKRKTKMLIVGAILLILGVGLEFFPETRTIAPLLIGFGVGVLGNGL